MPNYDIRICTVLSTVGHIIKLFSAITRNRYWKKITPEQMHIYSWSSLLFFSFLTVRSAFTSPESSAMPSLAWPRSSGWLCPQGHCPTHLIHDRLWLYSRSSCLLLFHLLSTCPPHCNVFHTVSLIPWFTSCSLFNLFGHQGGKKINPLYTCCFCRTFISSASSLWCLFLLLHLPPVCTVNTWVWYIFLHWYQTMVWVFFKLSWISSITKHWARKSTRAYLSD